MQSASRSKKKGKLFRGGFVEYILRETTVQVAYRKYSARTLQSDCKRQRAWTSYVNKAVFICILAFWYITACVRILGEFNSGIKS